MRFTLFVAFALACSPRAEPVVTPSPEPTTGPAEHDSIEHDSIEHDSTGHDSTGHDSTELEAAAPSAPEEEVDAVAAPERTGPCTTASDCTVVRDRCGAPHPRLVGDAPTPPSAPDPCPPATNPLREPACHANTCVLVDVQHRDPRTCEQTSDCVVIDGACRGAFRVANRASRAAIEAEIEAQRSIIRCVAPRETPRPTTECVANVCILRAP